MRRSCSITPTFRPNIEGFERSLMACSVVAGPGVLTIAGDAASGLVLLRDNGDGAVQGSATGYGGFPRVPLQSISALHSLPA